MIKGKISLKICEEIDSTLIVVKSRHVVKDERLKDPMLTFASEKICQL
jgi:hypothetical protein